MNFVEKIKNLFRMNKLDNKQKIEIVYSYSTEEHIKKKEQINYRKEWKEFYTEEGWKAFIKKINELTKK